MTKITKKTIRKKYTYKIDKEAEWILFYENPNHSFHLTT